jgi:hypothetical protein
MAVPFWRNWEFVRCFSPFKQLPACLVEREICFLFEGVVKGAFFGVERTLHHLDQSSRKI